MTAETLAYRASLVLMVGGSLSIMLLVVLATVMRH